MCQCIRNPLWLSGMIRNSHTKGPAFESHSPYSFLPGAIGLGKVKCARTGNRSLYFPRPIAQGKKLVRNLGFEPGTLAIAIERLNQ